MKGSCSLVAHETEAGQILSTVVDMIDGFTRDFKLECLLLIGLNQSHIEIVSCLANREHIRCEMTP